MFLTFVKGYLQGRPHPDYWLSLCYLLHHNIPLIWPDHVGSDKGRGWVFTPQRIGLLSGLKITSEEGTFINMIVNLAALEHAGVLNESAMLDYLVQYRNGNVGSGREYFHVMSDDDLLIHDSPATLFKVGSEFREATKRAGLKGSLEFGDRFLMRHCLNGRDTPVPARVWQNTISNEEPYTDPLKFLVGLGMRSDGLLGQKTVDPFGTGTLQEVTRVELGFTVWMLESIRSFMTTASSPQSHAINFVTSMVEIGKSMLLNSEGKRTAKMSHEDALVLDKMRKVYLATLAERESQSILDAASILDRNSLSTMLYNLHKQSNIPSQKLLLDQIIAMNSSAASALAKIANKENAFYQYAMRTIGVPVSL